MNVPGPILAMPFPIVIRFNPEQPKNALFPRLVTELAITIFFNSIQFLKAEPIIFVTALPKAISVNPVQPSNADVSIEVRALPITTLFIPVQFLNALNLIEVNLDGNTIESSISVELL